MRCDECRWFDDTESRHLETGSCRRRSPIAVQYPWPLSWELDGDGTTTQLWPEVRRQEWCGEFRRVREGDETDVQIETPSIQVGTGDRLLTGEELADHLNVSRAQVYNFLKRGMPSLKLGKSRRYRLSDVTTWLDQFNETAST